MNKELLEIIQNGDVEKLDQFFLANPQVKKSDENLKLAFQYAIQYGHIGMVEYLLKDGSKNTEINKTGQETLLRLAVQYGQVSMIDYFVEKGVELLAGPLLFIAIAFNQKKVIEYLVNSFDFNLNRQDGIIKFSLVNRGEMCFFVTCLFLKKGIYINFLEEEKLRIRDTLYKTVELIMLVNASKALFDLIRSVDISTEAKIEETIAFLDGGLNGREKETGNTALHLAIFFKKTGIIKILLESGADVLLKNNKGDTPLSLLLKFYPNEHHFLALSYSNILHDMEETISLQKKYPSLLNLRKKTGKEGIETYEKGKEELFLSEIRQKLKQCKQYLKSFQDSLSKITIKTGKDKIAFKMAKLLSNNEHTVFAPKVAHQLLLSMDAGRDEQSPYFQEVQKMLVDLTFLSKVNYKDVSTQVKPTELNAPVSLVKNQKENEERLLSLIKYILNSDSEHEAVLGKFISEYIYEENSLMGIKGVTDNSVESRIALLRAFGQEAELTKKREAEILKEKAEIKRLEEELHNKTLDIQKKQQELDREEQNSILSTVDKNDNKKREMRSV